MPQISDVKIRLLIVNKSKSFRAREHPSIFYNNGGHWQGCIRPQFFPIALATSSEGVRFLSDECLDAVMPMWRNYLSSTQPKPLPGGKKKLQDLWMNWIGREKDKLIDLGLTWPSQHDPEQIFDMGDETRLDRLVPPSLVPPSGLPAQGAQIRDQKSTPKKRSRPDENVEPSSMPNKRATPRSRDPSSSNHNNGVEQTQSETEAKEGQLKCMKDLLDAQERDYNTTISLKQEVKNLEAKFEARFQLSCSLVKAYKAFEELPGHGLMVRRVIEAENLKEAQSEFRKKIEEIEKMQDEHKEQLKQMIKAERSLEKDLLQAGKNLLAASERARDGFIKALE
ncbi:hypothetical protein N7466_009990 [Penicillium verhagenii]|uniref:uncharacterized protein n=1 Tax=Penicillium verhagenii TaxID=1562060 RepID=UPI0025453E58|nr:uncharacterized protein N7466_009990 [Penicillium verhagenii]KAJ5919047.1 hypothetical protein N7466_009990 [Penicillium verhagenii]